MAVIPPAVAVIGRCMIALSVLLIVVLTGCAASPGPAQLHLSHDEYHNAFDAAIEAARKESLVGGFRDRRAGVVETQPTSAPTMLEPWHAVREPMQRTLESTLGHQRRRARFEFMPLLAPDDQASAAALDLLAVDEVDADLTRYEGAMQLRVLVHVERLQRPGLRRSTWTRRAASTATGPEDDVTENRPFWVPMGRDEAMERRLLARVEKALGK